jgi:hypothetical protein
MSGDTHLCQMGAQHIVETQHRFAEVIVCDKDAAQADRVAQSAADRLGEGFLGRANNFSKRASSTRSVPIPKITFVPPAALSFY